METGLTNKHTRYLTATSLLTTISVYYSYKNNYYLSTILTLSVLLSSINYWRYPIHGFRKDLDNFLVKSTLLIQTILFVLHPYYKYYITFNIVGYLFFLIGQELRKLEYHWLSVFFHSMLHLFSNIANVCIFTN